MKKILFLMPDLEGGGAERALINLLREFDYTKYKVTLCLMYHRGVYQRKSIRYICLRMRGVSFFGKRGNAI